LTPPPPSNSLLWPLMPLARGNAPGPAAAAGGRAIDGDPGGGAPPRRGGVVDPARAIPGRLAALVTAGIQVDANRHGLGICGLCRMSRAPTIGHQYSLWPPARGPMQTQCRQMTCPPCPSPSESDDDPTAQAEPLRLTEHYSLSLSLCSPSRPTMGKQALYRG
jgi:hypothetical protein